MCCPAGPSAVVVVVAADVETDIAAVVGVYVAVINTVVGVIAVGVVVVIQE